MVSEFMLQQTTVTAVIPYFQRWMARFPTLEDLARAAESDVLALWQGLGYYSRARNLHRAAKAVMEGGEGRVPRSVEALRRLPGVGEYTARGHRIVRVRCGGASGRREHRAGPCPPVELA